MLQDSNKMSSVRHGAYHQRCRVVNGLTMHDSSISESAGARFLLEVSVSAVWHENLSKERQHIVWTCQRLMKLRLLPPGLLPWSPPQAD